MACYFYNNVTILFFSIYKELSAIDINDQSTFSNRAENINPIQTESTSFNELNNDPSTISILSTTETSSFSSTASASSTSSHISQMVI